MRGTWSTTHGTDVLAGLERDVFPALGDRAAASITAPELLVVLRGIEARGRIETARRLRQRLSMIFRYGTAEGFLEDDPAEWLGAAMRSSRPPRPHPALTAIEDCRALLHACIWDSGMQGPVVTASHFLALTAARLDAVRGMRWDEVEDLDGPAPLWRVPPARMKLKRDKKGEARFEHLVPLAPAAVDLLRIAKRYLVVNDKQGGAEPHSKGYDAPLVFPGRGGAVPLGERAIGTLYARAGFAGRHVPHGWRASFSTILNEQLGDEWSAAIDRALAHSPKDKVEAAYNRALQLDRRRQLFARWAEMLTR
jgi:integrase